MFDPPCNSTQRSCVRVARTWSDFDPLIPDIELLLESLGRSGDLTMDPVYFRAWVKRKRARPFVVAVSNAGQLIGIFYGVQHEILGAPIGLYEFGDSCGDTSILAHDAHVDEIVRATADYIGRRAGLLVARLTWKPSEASSAFQSNSSIDANERVSSHQSNFDARNLLHLASTYDQFIAKLSYKARRNMRHDRRSGEQKGWRFSDNIDHGDAVRIFKALHPRQQTNRASSNKLVRYLKMLAEVPGSFFAGLQGANGEWISIIGGWVKNVDIYILVQLNDTSYSNSSVSAVLRGYVIEAAIANKVCRMTFLDGCSGLLRPYTSAQCSHILIRKESLVGTVVARSLSRSFPLSTFARLLSAHRMNDGDPGDERRVGHDS